jgi:hypothetical protein
MESFYRAMGQRIGLLMNGDEPAGGRWNFDADNRKSARPDVFMPRPKNFSPDETTDAVSVGKGAAARIEAGGKPVSATPCQLEGDLTCKLWYRDDCWLKLRFSASDGTMIDDTLDPKGERA